jgi:MFS family permease
MFPQLGAPLGFIAANGLFLLLGLVLSPEQFVAWGWRLPFVASLVLIAVGLWVRLRLGETPAFEAARRQAPPPRVPLMEVVRAHLLPVLGGTFAVVCCFAIFYLSTVFTLGYGTKTLGYARETFLAVQLGAILFMAAGIVVAGYWADATSPRRVLMTGCALTVGAGLVLAPLLGSGSLALVFLFLALALFLMGLVYGPLGAFLPGLFPARVRYTGVSIAFNVGGIIGGGLAPIAAQALVDAGGLALVGLYLASAGAVSFVALAALRRPALT